VTDSTAVTVYREARTRGSSRTMLDLRPAAGDMHAAVARDEDRARAVVIEETDRHLPCHDDDLGEGIRHQARRRAHGRAGDPVDGAPAPRIDDGEPAHLRAHAWIESAPGRGKGAVAKQDATQEPRRIARVTHVNRLGLPAEGGEVAAGVDEAMRC